MKLRIVMDFTIPDDAIPDEVDLGSYRAEAPALLSQDIRESLTGFEPGEFSNLQVTLVE